MITEKKTNNMHFHPENINLDERLISSFSNKNIEPSHSFSGCGGARALYYQNQVKNEHVGARKKREPNIFKPGN